MSLEQAIFSGCPVNHHKGEVRPNGLTFRAGVAQRVLVNGEALSAASILSPPTVTFDVNQVRLESVRVHVRHDHGRTATTDVGFSGEAPGKYGDVEWRRSHGFSKSHTDFAPLTLSVSRSFNTSR